MRTCFIHWGSQEGMTPAGVKWEICGCVTHTRPGTYRVASLASPSTIRTAEREIDFIQLWGGKRLKWPLKSVTDVNHTMHTKEHPIGSWYELLDQKKDMGNTASRKAKLLQRAVCIGDTQRVKLLLKAGADVNLRDSSGLAPLFSATSRDDAHCVKILLEAGADVNKVDNFHRTPLCTAAIKGYSDCAKLLIEAGADVNKTDYVEDTPLLWAACLGDAPSMKQLLEAGADMTKGDKYGDTPLMWASCQGHVDCVRLCATIASSRSWCESGKLWSEVAIDAENPEWRSWQCVGAAGGRRWWKWAHTTVGSSQPMSCKVCEAAAGGRSCCQPSELYWANTTVGSSMQSWYQFPCAPNHHWGHIETAICCRSQREHLKW